MTIEWTSGVRSEERVAAVEDSGLLGTGPDDAFDRFVELAAELTGAKRCCITLVDADSFNYLSTMGVAEGFPDSGKIEESFCRYVVGEGRPLVVNDALNDPRVLDNPAIELYGVVAWAGYPIEDSRGNIFGTFCLIDTEPHTWSDRDILILATLAKAVSTEIALRLSRAETAAARKELENLRDSRREPR